MPAASTFTWASATSGDWNTASNWTPTGIPNGAGANAVINAAGTYTVTIAASASDLLNSLEIDAGAGTLEVDGTLSFGGSAGSIIGSAQSSMVVTGTVINAGTVAPVITTNGNALFTGSNPIDFQNQVQVSSGTATIVSTGGNAEITGSVWAGDVYVIQGGATLDVGGTGEVVNIATVGGNSAYLILNGAGAALDEWNGTTYVPLESSLQTINTGAIVYSANRDFISANTITLDDGTMIVSGDTVTVGELVLQNNGYLRGNTTTITNNILNNGTLQVGDGALILQGTITGSGQISAFVGEAGTLEIAGPTNNSVLLNSDNLLQLDNPNTFTGTLSSSVGSTILLQGVTADSAVVTGGSLVVSEGSTAVYSVAVSGDYSADHFTVTAGGSGAQLVETSGAAFNVVNNTATAIAAGGTNDATAGLNPTGNVLTSDSGSGLNVTTVSAGSTSGTVGSPLVGSHGTLTLDSNGSYTYTVNNSDAAVQALNVGQSTTDTFTYTVNDNSTDSASATLTVIIDGQDQAPVASSIPNAMATVGTAFSDTITAFSDPDNSPSQITYTATQSDSSPLPSWLSFNSSSLTFSGTPSSSDEGPLNITVTGTDPESESATATFTLTTSAASGVVCFARGSRIRTPDGDVAVEELAVGDAVVTISGRIVPVQWIGRRRINCLRHPEPSKVWPVRIRANAFGPAMPERDLLLSPQHAIYDEDVLIPVRYLINGRNVLQEQVDAVEYFHVELAQHDVLLAEGLPAESYLENNDRDTFENSGASLVLHPDLSRWSWDARGYAELKVVGPEIDAVRAKLARRAKRISLRPGVRGVHAEDRVSA